MSRWVVLLLLCACDGPATGTDAAVDGGGVENDGGTDAGTPVTEREGFVYFRDHVQPAIAERCASCHVGQRFNITSLSGAPSFDEPSTIANYEAWLLMLSLDHPEASRLLAKILPESDPSSVRHHAGPQIAGTDDPLYTTLRGWIDVEKRERCERCGLTSERAYIAYVEQPAIFWMIEPDPVRTDRGERRGARIRMQSIDPATFAPSGAPFDFLPASFCPDGDCDYGRLAIDHAGERMVFECKRALAGEAWIDRSWNLCVAQIGADGRAVDPRFLIPEAERHRGRTYTRTDPFGFPDGEGGVVSPYNVHYEVRRRADRFPIFTPDDRRVVFASQAPDPRTGTDMVQTYHGSFHLPHLVSVNLEGGDRETVLHNEGGTLDYPFYLANGNLAAHSWNLERMDRHFYVQSTADGMMEVPLLVGRHQGPNMWGAAVELVNGLVLGETGRRRAQMDLYSPFLSDHTLGISTATAFTDGLYRGYREIIPDLHAELDDYGFCYATSSPADAAVADNCSLSRYIRDPSWLPDGRVLVTYNPERTYLTEGEQFTLFYTRGDNVADRQASAQAYLPRQMGIGVMDRHGNVATHLDNPDGTLLRYPVWVGRRQPPRIQQRHTDESLDHADLHIANFPLWLIFDRSPYMGSHGARFSQLSSEITAVRVLVKVMAGGACIDDPAYIEMSNAATNGYHPTALGLIDSTGYEQLIHSGGTVFGDVPLAADGSVNLRVPAGPLLLFQGVDAAGRVVAQHTRVFSLPPRAERIDTSVRADQYTGQCARCHGVIDGSVSFDATQRVEDFAAVLTYDTLAAAQAPIDLSTTSHRSLTFRDAVRPILDTHCVSCHAGESPAGELSLQAAYSADGNFPRGSWETRTNSVFADYVAYMRGTGAIRPSYNFSVSYGWLMRDDQAQFRTAYATEMAEQRAIGPLAPWDSGYQNLFRPHESMGFTYLNTVDYTVQYGRVSGERANGARSYLMEILTGADHDPNQSYAGSFDHTSLLNDLEIRTLYAVMDVGMPYMARCDDQIVPAGRNSGAPWGDPDATTR
jgi:hypothetical protein